MLAREIHFLLQPYPLKSSQWSCTQTTPALTTVYYLLAAHERRARAWVGQAPSKTFTDRVSSLRAARRVRTAPSSSFSQPAALHAIPYPTSHCACPIVSSRRGRRQPAFPFFPPALPPRSLAVPACRGTRRVLRARGVGGG